MDETSKPSRIPPQISAYADRHNSSHSMQIMVTSSSVEMPEDPICYLISVSRGRSSERPRSMLLGPPAVGKRSSASRLGAASRAVPSTTESLSQGGSAAVSVQRLQQRSKEKDCSQRGWVLVGIPQNRLQVSELQRAGIIPEHVVMSEAPEDVSSQRSRGKLIDPITGDVYHQIFVRPDDDTVARRSERGRSSSDQQSLSESQRYRCDVTASRSAYQHVSKVVNGDQPPADVFQQASTFVRTRRHFRTPRILSSGPPGSGKSHSAHSLSEKYKSVDVSCGRSSRSVAAEGSGPGAEIQWYSDDSRPVPDSSVSRVSEDRSGRVDCSCRGWISHGFPCDSQQARNSQESRYQPNRVFFSEVTDDVCSERLSSRATDPVSGQRYHSVTRPAPSADVQNRLQTAPADGAEAVTSRSKQFRIRSAASQSVYPDAVHLEADQDPQSVSEASESRLYTN